MVLVSCKMASALHLLMVDDQPESLIGLAGHLEARGHRLQICTDPLEALRRIAAQLQSRDPFHLIFCDVNLPGLDGPGLVRELRLRGDQTPVVFITGYNSVAARLRSELGPLQALGLLTKPPPLQEIERFIEQASRMTRSSVQDRRSTEFGLGSGGHPLVGNVPGPARSGGGGNADPFYGTSRTFRTKYTTPEPTEGILSRVIKPSHDHNIIPDDVVTGRTSATGRPPANAAPPRNLRTPLPGSPGPGDGLTPLRTRKPDPSGFYYMPNEVTGTTPQPGELHTQDTLPVRDPVTGQLKRPSGFYQPEQPAGLRLPPPNPPSGLRPPASNPLSGQRQPVTEPTARPGTTSRFRRSVGGVPPGPVAGTPPANASTGLTSRIRRGITQVQPLAAPSAAADMPSCAVACAHCQHQFTVVIKPESYTVICVHCGQLNRIDPL